MSLEECSIVPNDVIVNEKEAGDADWVVPAWDSKGRHTLSMLPLGEPVMNMAGICLISTVWAFVGGGSTTASKDFVLQAETVEALEGGPVVIRLKLTYQGVQPIKILSYSTGPVLELGISVAQGWKPIPKPKIVWLSDRIATRTLNPREELSHIFLHIKNTLPFPLARPC
jgi:hypothetical protein